MPFALQDSFVLTGNQAALNRETYVTHPALHEAVGEVAGSCDEKQLWSGVLQPWGDWLNSECQG